MGIPKVAISGRNASYVVCAIAIAAIVRVVWIATHIDIGNLDDDSLDHEGA